MKQLELSSAINFHLCPTDDIDEFIRIGLDLHRELGFASVNLSYAQIDAMGENYEKHIDTAAKMAKERGLRYGMAHLPYVAQRNGLPQGDEFYKRVCRCIDAFKLAGVDYAVVHPNSTTVPLAELDPVKEYDNVMGHLAPFVEYGNKVGLSIVVENMRMVHGSAPMHRYCGTPDELCKVADALGVGICWDTGHANIVGLTQSEAIKYIGDRLKVLHLNDNFGGEDIHLAPFCGTVDWADTMQGLSDIGFDGYLNFEVSTARMPGAVRKAIGAYLVAAGKELLSLMK